MKFTRQIFSSLLYLGLVVSLFIVAAIPVRSQSQTPSQLLKLRTSVRELQVFEDGTVVETRDGIKTTRRLSASRMRKLRQVMARVPCQKEWQQSSQPLPDLSRVQITAVQLGTYNEDCLGMWLSYGLGLQEIQVTMKYPDLSTGPFPVYILCDGAKKKYKEFAKRNYKSSLRPNWHRFLNDVVSVVGGKSILKGCNAWQS
jgi:hypothetical protein